MKWLAVMLLLSAPLLAAEEETPQTLLDMTTTQADLALVDPELSQANIPKLVLPPQEPPINVRLQELIIKSDEWRGSQCGVVESRLAVFRHPDKWESFWVKAMSPISHRLSKVPPVDFGKNMVVGVFMGEMRYPLLRNRNPFHPDRGSTGSGEGPGGPVPRNPQNGGGFCSAF